MAPVSVLLLLMISAVLAYNSEPYPEPVEQPDLLADRDSEAFGASAVGLGDSDALELPPLPEELPVRNLPEQSSGLRSLAAGNSAGEYFPNRIPEPIRDLLDEPAPQQEAAPVWLTGTIEAGEEDPTIPFDPLVPPVLEASPGVQGPAEQLTTDPASDDVRTIALEGPASVTR